MNNNVMLPDQVIDIVDAVGLDKPNIGLLDDVAHELTDNLRKNISIDWSKRESVRASLRLMVKRILRKYKYPPDMAEDAV
ncbi:type I restriction enzyme endonuclease domain-containing protein [Rheinheimera baltica]|uniref:type I restriction enzyme endonuclease domain-containing protein n=1 Tax=Rheinheimera baltica TaxID=67576 RepID=UPI0003FFAC10|nr:type I restriction enzyme endonuclease domain-containing protein [Rheinheimera baltica]